MHPRLIKYAFTILIAAATLAFTVWLYCRVSTGNQRLVLDRALISAVKRNNITQVQAALEQGANPNAYDTNRATTVAGLLSQFYATAFHGKRFGTGTTTALHLAAVFSDVKISQILLEGGADPNLHNGRGLTALHFAALGGKVPVMRLLLQKGSVVDAKNGNGETPLINAVGGSPVCVSLLLVHGADIDHRTDRGTSALMRAAQMGDRSLVERLIRAGADVNAADASGRTVLWWAKYSGSHDILVRLRKAGAQDLIKNQL